MLNRFLCGAVPVLFPTACSHAEKNRSIVSEHSIAIACIHDCQHADMIALEEASASYSYDLAIINISSADDLDSQEFDGVLIEGGADINVSFYNSDWLMDHTEHSRYSQRQILWRMNLIIKV